MAKRDRTPEPPKDEDFLHRWSRRKARARRESAEPAPVAEREQLPAAGQDTEAKSIDPADLPDVESLTKDSDFKVFMQEGVPAHLRTLALRKLWRLNPALANLDGLIDYGEDFTDAARIVPNLKSAYEAGKGFARRIEKVEKVVEDEAAKVPQQGLEAPSAPAQESGAEAERPRSEEGASASRERDRRVDHPSRRPLPKRG